MDPVIVIAIAIVLAVVGVLVRVYAYRAGAELRRRHPPSRRATQIAYVVFGALCAGAAAVAFVRGGSNRNGVPAWVLGVLGIVCCGACIYQAWRLRHASGTASG